MMRKGQLAKAFGPAGAVPKLSISAQMKGGGLHLWVDGKEIKPLSAKIEITK